MFLLDANVLITAADNHYPVDVAPGFWDQLLGALEAGEAQIPVSVYRELTVQKGRWLTGWLNSNVPSGSAAVLQEDDSQLVALQEVTKWLSSPGRSFAQRHIWHFLNGADPRLIAAARATRASIVTYEEYISDPNVRKVKIPNVAQPFNVECIKPVDMFRRLKRTM